MATATKQLESVEQYQPLIEAREQHQTLEAELETLRTKAARARERAGQLAEDPAKPFSAVEKADREARDLARQVTLAEQRAKAAGWDVSAALADVRDQLAPILDAELAELATEALSHVEALFSIRDRLAQLKSEHNRRWGESRRDRRYTDLQAMLVPANSLGQAERGLRYMARKLGG